MHMKKNESIENDAPFRDSFVEDNLMHERLSLDDRQTLAKGACDERMIMVEHVRKDLNVLLLALHRLRSTSANGAAQHKLVESKDWFDKPSHVKTAKQAIADADEILDAFFAREDGEGDDEGLAIDLLCQRLSDALRPVPIRDSAFLRWKTEGLLEFGPWHEAIHTELNRIPDNSGKESLVALHAAADGIYAAAAALAHSMTPLALELNEQRYLPDIKNGIILVRAAIDEPLSTKSKEKKADAQMRGGLRQLLRLLQQTYFRHTFKSEKHNDPEKTVFELRDSHRHLLAHTGVAISAAKYVKRAMGNLADFDDLVQDGAAFLTRASLSHDPAKSALTTYTIPYIKKQLFKHVHENRFIALPGHIIDRVSSVRKAAMEFDEVKGGTPFERVAWIGQKLRISNYDVQNALEWGKNSSYKPVSLESYLRNTHEEKAGYKEEDPAEMTHATGDEWKYLKDTIPDEKTPPPDAIADVHEVRERIAAVLNTLSYREREIIKLRYGLNDGYSYSLEEVGNIFKVTRERIRQIEMKAIRKLQQPSRIAELEEFKDMQLLETDYTFRIVPPEPIQTDVSADTEGDGESADAGAEALPV